MNNYPEFIEGNKILNNKNLIDFYNTSTYYYKKKIPEEISIILNKKLKQKEENNKIIIKKKIERILLNPQSNEELTEKEFKYVLNKNKNLFKFRQNYYHMNPTYIRKSDEDIQQEKNKSRKNELLLLQSLLK